MNHPVKRQEIVKDKYVDELEVQLVSLRMLLEEVLKGAI